MKYKVEPGFEIPTKKARMEIDYPFDEMKIGDSFLVALVKEEFKPRLGMKTAVAASVKVKITRQATYYAKVVDGSFKIKICERPNILDRECGLRVWRVEPKKKS